ncbi:MAG TPA: TetR family transcriptional regulator [Candidatus Omnitrophota bacterium]|nr:TetR family transcriptional regulator [Candidatus Omnitrophota bacterium]
MSTREQIIDAAMTIVREQGVAKLTLDAAAKQAGLSKGGVLYHFKTKDDLIRGMVERLIGSCDILHHRYYAEEPEGPYRWARTVVRTAFDPNGPASDKVGGALLASVTVNPELAAPIHAKFDEWIARIHSDSPNPALAALVCMAMDGYYFERMMGLDLCNAEQLEKIKQTALDLLK